MMPEEIKKQLNKDIKMLKDIDEGATEYWNEDLQERRLTFEEIGKLIHAGKDDIDIIFSSNTETYWLYSNVLDAYCDMNYENWEQKEEVIEKLVDDREYLFPTMGWIFGHIEL